LPSSEPASSLDGRPAKLVKRDFVSGDLRDRVLAGRLEQLWYGVPTYKPLSVGVTLLDLARHNNTGRILWENGNGRAALLRWSTASIGALVGTRLALEKFRIVVQKFTGHAAFQRVPESWEF
jgi:hypothetical protein